MQRGRRAIWIVGILCAPGLILLVVVFGPGLSGAESDRATRAPRQAGFPEDTSGSAPGQEEPGELSSASADRESGDNEPSGAAERIRFERHGAYGDSDGACVAVEARDEFGRPFSGLCVRIGLSSPGGLLEAIEGETDELGQAVLEKVAVNSAVLEVAAGGAELRREVTCRAGRRYLASIVFPRAGVPVTGSVTDQSRGAQAVVPLTLDRSARRGESSLTYRTTTDRHGVYRFDHVAPGAYWLVVRKDEVGWGDAATYGIVVPESGHLVRDVKVGVLNLSVAVRHSDTGVLIENLWGVFADPVGEDPATSGIDAHSSSGRFGFTDLPPGLYDISVAGSGYGSVTVPNVQVDSDHERHLEIRLEPEAIVDLQVLDAEGHPFGGIIRFGLGAPVRPAFVAASRTDSEGRAMIRCVPPGRDRGWVITADGNAVAELALDLARGKNRVTAHLKRLADDS